FGLDADGRRGVRLVRLLALASGGREHPEVVAPPLAPFTQGVDTPRSPNDDQSTSQTTTAPDAAPAAQVIPSGATARLGRPPSCQSNVCRGRSVSRAHVRTTPPCSADASSVPFGANARASIGPPVGSAATWRRDETSHSTTPPSVPTASRRPSGENSSRRT